MTATASPLSLELRVLAGRHQGAVATLATGDFSLTLAADGEADVLLRDAPGQAQLQCEAGVHRWLEPGFEQMLAPGQLWRWGGAVLSLANAQAPWPESLPDTWPGLLFDRQVAPALAPESVPVSEVTPAAVPSPAQPRTAAADADLPDPPNLPELPELPELSPTAAKPAPPRRMHRLAVVVAGALVMALSGLWWLVGSAMPTSSLPLPAPSPARAEQPVNLARVKATLVQLGLNAQVQAQLRDDGRLLLRGVVPDDEQLNALLRAVAVHTRRISPQLITQDELVARTRALQPNLPEGIQAQAQEGGRLVLQASSQDVNWVLARQLTDSELPEVVSVEHQVSNVPGSVLGHWLPSAPAPVAAAVSKSPSVSAPSSLSALAALPAITAVMGGARPYVLLADGDKWLPGGQIGSVVLQSIDDEAVVFDLGQGRVLRKPR